MPTLSRSVLSLVCLLVFAPAAGAAPPQPREEWSHAAFRHHGDAALAGATALAQDQTGFIWLGTRHGLVRWDGLRQRRYRANPAQAGALPDSDILSLHVDQGGRLWVGTSAGLARYDAAADRFVSIPTGRAGLSHGRIAAMADDGGGGIWVGTGAGLEHVRGDGKVLAAASGAPRLGARVLGDGGVTALLREGGGGLWIGTRAGLFYRATDAQPPAPVSLGAGASQAAISALHQDSKGRIWIGTGNRGAFMLDRAGATPRPAAGTSQQDRVLSFAEKSQDVIWIGLAGGGIVEVDNRSGGTRRLRHQPGAQDSLPDHDALAMLRERGGQMFIATAAGLSQHDPRTQGVTTVRASGSNVTSVLARSNGEVWLGTLGGAVDIIDARLGRTAGSPERRIGAGALPPGPVLALADGPDGAVYIGTQQGLYRSGAGGADLRRALEGAVSALAWHRDVLWLGGPDGLRAVSMGAQPSVVRHEAASLGDGRVTAILPASDGGIWVGTSTGLARLQPVGRKVERVPAGTADPTRLAPGGVASLLIDRKGRLWIAHAAGGVSVLERTDRAGRRWFKQLTPGDGLPDGRVNVLLSDHRGQIWIGTDAGLASIDPATYRVRRLGFADGVPLQAYTSGAAARADTGALLLGGAMGLTVVQPDRLQRKAGLPTVAVTRLNLGGRDLPVAPFNGPADVRTAVTVTPQDQERGFELDFAALDFAPPHASPMSYRLKGVDHDWVDADGGARRVSYTNLAPGEYTLQLRAGTTAAGDPAVHALSVQVQPAWHQRIWVRMLSAMIVLGAAGALVRARIARMRATQRELEDMLEARAAELQAIQAELDIMTHSDALTGLANRRRFNDEMQLLAAQVEQGGERFTLLLIDLDGFGGINESFGFAAGDAMLVEVARRLKRAMRDCDLVARFGDDEFAVLMPLHLSKDTIGRICARIRASLSQPIGVGDYTMQISASIGAGSFVSGADALASMYRTAGADLREAKEAQRDGWHGGASQAAA